MKWSLTVLLISLVASSCRESVDLRQLENYTGPYRVTSGMEVYRSDSAVVTVKVVAEKQLVFENGDSEFPEGIMIYFYEKDGSLRSTIRADHGFQDTKEKIYRGEGDVRVHNIKKGTKLNSEELYWDERKKTIYTEKFVTVEQDDGNIVNANGMRSDETLNDITFYDIVDTYVILKEEEQETGEQ
ncbi:hypothetical protein GCM10028791_17720 [Echinicola sediminis]